MEFNGMFSVQNLTKCRLRGKWIPLVVYLLRDGHPQRYAQLKGQISGISQKMLTQTLRQLENEGIITRTVYPTVPPTVEYELTAKGKNILELFLEMAEKTNGEEVILPRNEYLLNKWGKP